MPNSFRNAAFYDLPNTISSRKAGFGYGNKYDFTQSAKKTPAPNAYNIGADGEGNKKGKGSSFGLGRDQISQGSIFTKDKHLPGPGAYTLPTSLSQVSFSMRPRTDKGSGIQAKIS